MTDCQSALVYLMYRYREQAPSHIGSSLFLRFVLVSGLALALVFITVTRFG